MTRLDEVIARSPGGLDVDRAVVIVEQLAAALDAAHRSRLVDGDVRATRVLLVDEGGRETARLADGQLQSATGDLDARADVYGLGLLLFETLTGRGLFDGPPARAIDLRPGLPAEFEGVFARALAPSSSDRYPSTGELASAARAAAGGAKASGSAGRPALVFAGLAAMALLAGIVAAVLLVTSGSGDGSGGQAQRPASTGPAAPVENPRPSDPVAGPAIPPVAERNLKAAAAAAGCTLSSPREEGKQHSANPADWVYKSNPPTSGTHAPVWAQDGAYRYGSAPNVGETTHALEHGRIDIQYGPKLTRTQYDRLQTLMAENKGYHQLLFENQTKMPGTIAAAAWTQLLSCPAFNPKVFDALRAFKTAYTDKGPESVP